MTAGSRRSERARVARAALAVFGLAAFAFSTAARGEAGARGTAARADSLRLEGEYGLTVRFEGDSVRVGWLTGRATPGMLRVVAGERVHFTTATPADSAHTASFRRPPGDRMTLWYGDRSAAGLHASTIDLRDRPRDPVRVGAADSIFAIGDIHGEFDTLAAVLRNAGLVDADLRWTGGRARLAVLGDMMDRGEDVTRVLWLLYRLELEAAAAGGGVHVVLGNHELMVLLGDLRYIGAKELTVARLHGVSYDRLFDPRLTVLGRWLATKPVLLRIGDVLFAHGGVSTAYLDHTLESVDDTLAAYMAEDLFYRWTDTTYVVPLDSAGLARRNAFFWDESSIPWYRGYVQADTLAAPLGAVLDRYGARLLVVGHTPADHIRQRYDGRLIATNTFPFAAEILLLTRAPTGWGRVRIATTGPPVPLR
jgi:hypothetical protein